jgi:hypothetical protein
MDGEQEGATPESVDMEEAVALMDDAAESEEAQDDPASPEASQDEEEGEEGESSEPEGEESAPPEFWAAEDKAAWNAVPAEVRPVLKKYEQQRVEFANEKAREAATARAQAAEEVQRANAAADQAAAWWRQNGPALQKAFADKWSKVDWKDLAEKNPAEYARLDQERQQEQAAAAEANRRGQAEIEAATQRAVQVFQQTKQAEHAKVAAELPDYFGTPEKARQTYDEMARYLFAQGIPADRISQIYEAPIIRLALKAMRFDQAQLARRSSAGAKEGRIPAQRTPTRVAPGPASAPSQARTGNRANDAARQVGERFRRSGGSDIQAAADLIRLNNL